MHRTQRHLLSILAAGTVALSLGAAPALAGSDGCSDGDCQDEDSPAAVVPVAPTPVAPAPLQTSTQSADDTSPKRASHRSNRHATRTSTRTSTRTRTVAQRSAQRTVPRGAVAAGAGGTAQSDPDGVLFGLGGAALVLLAAGGRLVAAGRRT